MGKKTWIDRIISVFVKAVILLYRVMPYKPAIALTRMLALVAYCFAHTERKIASTQMQAALGPEFRPEMVRKVFLNYADVFVDAIKYAHMSDEEVSERMKIKGVENLEAARASGRGVMIIISHAGNWEIQSNVARILGFEFCVMAALEESDEAGKVINDMRRRAGATILPPTGKLLMLIRELKMGRIIAFIIDKRGEKGTNLFCNFFGMPALTNPAPAFIASKSDAMIVPLYCKRNGFSYDVTICQAVDTRVFSGDVVQSISDYMHGWTESVIRMKPERWIWTYSRWIRRSEIKGLIKSGGDFKRYAIEKSKER